MSKTNLKEPLLIRTVRELAAEKPDFFYKTKDGACLYTPNDEQPGCIFGQALLRMGYTKEELSKLDEDNGLDIIEALKVLDIRSLTNEELQWCSDVQQLQDFGDNWRKVIENTDAEREYYENN
jgi:hypothetical protein